MDRNTHMVLAKAMLDTGAQPETVLMALRLEGASQGECVLAFFGKTGRWSVGEVKNLVDGSRTWSDHSEARAAFISQAIDFLEQEYGKGEAADLFD